MNATPSLCGDCIVYRMSLNNCRECQAAAGRRRETKLVYAEICRQRGYRGSDIVSLILLCIVFAGCANLSQVLLPFNDQIARGPCFLFQIVDRLYKSSGIETTIFCEIIAIPA